MIFTTVIICLLAFTVGYLFGKTRYPKNGIRSERQPEFLGLSNEEIKNFLNYDGTEQI